MPVELYILRQPTMGFYFELILILFIDYVINMYVPIRDKSENDLPNLFKKKANFLKSEFHKINLLHVK